LKVAGTAMQATLKASCQRLLFSVEECVTGCVDELHAFGPQPIRQRRRNVVADQQRMVAVDRDMMNGGAKGCWP
jgi:hypothetical protein